MMNADAILDARSQNEGRHDAAPRAAVRHARCGRLAMAVHAWPEMCLTCCGETRHSDRHARCSQTDHPFAPSVASPPPLHRTRAHTEP